MESTVEITREVLDEADDDFRSHRFVQVHDMAFSDGKIVITPEETTQREEFHLDTDAQNYLANFLSVPLGYISSLEDAHLRSALWNYHIRKRGGDIDILKAVVHGEIIKTFTTKGFNTLLPSAVIQACADAIPDCVLERSIRTRAKFVDFFLTGPDMYEEFANTLGMASDVHHFSIGTEYNFMGDESPKMGSFGHRHSCGNIMDAPYGITGKQFRIFTTKPEEMLTKFTEYTRKGVEFVRSTLIPKIRATMQSQVPEMANEIADLARKYGLPESVEGLIMESARAEDLGGSMYHLVNSITRAANSDRCPVQFLQKLHRIAGEITSKYDPSQPIRRCNECHQKIKKALPPPTDVPPVPEPS